MAALLSLPAAKETLNITSQQFDNEIVAYVEAATDMIEARVGPIVSRTVTETLTASDGVLVLSYLPVISITSVVGVFSGALTYLPAGLTANPRSGVVRALDRSSLRTDSYTVVYVAGRTGPIAPRFMQAARVLLQHLWSTQRGSGGGAARGSGGGAARGSNEPPAGVGYSMPNRVLELLALDMSLPGIG